MSYDWNFSWVWNNIGIMFKGLSVTLELTLATFILGYLLSLFFFVLRTSKSKTLKVIGICLIEITRDIPVLISMVWLYFCIPQLMKGIQVPPFWIAVLGLSLNFSGLQAEIIRAGYDAIPKPQIDVANSFGFNRFQIFRHIIFPQAFWRSLAPTLGQIINTLKLSSLASFITVNELFYATNSLIQDTFRPLEFYTAMAVLYLMLIIPISILTQLLQNKLSNRFNG
jgi:polar amino acid transport system permease protein